MDQDRYSLGNGFVTYFVQAENGLIKIGRSARCNLETRMRDLFAIMPVEVCLLGYTDKHEEADLHRQFDSLRVRGEWFFPHVTLLDFIREHITRCDFAAPIRGRKNIGSPIRRLVK